VELVALLRLCVLHEAGFEVKIFESVKEIRPLGVGIIIFTPLREGVD
jgi:hypothetical protein